MVFVIENSGDFIKCFDALYYVFCILGGVSQGLVFLRGNDCFDKIRSYLRSNYEKSIFRVSSVLSP